MNNDINTIWAALDSGSTDHDLRMRAADLLGSAAAIARHCVQCSVDAMMADGLTADRPTAVADIREYVCIEATTGAEVAAAAGYSEEEYHTAWLEALDGEGA